MLRLFCSEWEKRKTLIKIKGKYDENDLIYTLCIHSICDVSLVSNEGIFKYKPPHILLSLWTSNPQAVIQFVTDVTDWEIREAKGGEVNDLQFKHAIYLKNIANWTLKHKFTQVSRENRRKIISGDLRPQTHFTIKKDFKG